MYFSQQCHLEFNHNNLGDVSQINSYNRGLKGSGYVLNLG